MKNKKVTALRIAAAGSMITGIVASAFTMFAMTPCVAATILLFNASNAEAKKNAET
ncbi:hypothetical protein [Ruminococcus sp.]|uniref:hypothetical protein n=1 Tax=Ruminococcus sp. TaxID=41978 RepID=UPI0025F13EED|nr:hypothetical protein [Ruminococcus sp.]MBQ8966358.1 hypothetical protein [Ruminococcus sp.]